MSETYERFPLEELVAERDVGSFERVNRPRDRLWASELGYCARAAWRSWHNPKPHDLGFTNGRGALGKGVEEIIAVKLRCVIAAREVSFTSEHTSGRADFVLRLERGGPQIPCEVKSTYAYDRFLAEPMESHLLQLRYYLREMPEPDAPFGLLLYYNLSNYKGGSGKWACLRISRDDAAVSAREARLWAIVHSETEPACDAPDPTDCFPCSLVARSEGGGPDESRTA